MNVNATAAELRAMAAQKAVERERGKPTISKKRLQMLSRNPLHTAHVAVSATTKGHEGAGSPGLRYWDYELSSIRLGQCDCAWSAFWRFVGLLRATM